MFRRHVGAMAVHVAVSQCNRREPTVNMMIAAIVSVFADRAVLRPCDLNSDVMWQHRTFVRQLRRLAFAIVKDERMTIAAIARHLVVPQRIS